jgi:DNA-binding transcriptional ArsR family regulator
MRTKPPELLPIFRSRGQGRLLARLFLQPERPAPLSELAREIGLDAGALSREADRLERAGLIRADRVGNQRLLRPNDESPFFPELQRLLLKAFGPAVVLGGALGPVADVERAYIFGSWAARYHGEPGIAPRDIDVLIVGRPSRSTVAGVTRDAGDALGLDVNPTIVPSDEWRDATSAFVRSVQRDPLVEIELRR